MWYSLRLVPGLHWEDSFFSRCLGRGPHTAPCLGSVPVFLQPRSMCTFKAVCCIRHVDSPGLCTAPHVAAHCQCMASCHYTVCWHLVHHYYFFSQRASALSLSVDPSISMHNSLACCHCVSGHRILILPLVHCTTMGMYQTAQPPHCTTAALKVPQCHLSLSLGVLQWECPGVGCVQPFLWIAPGRPCLHVSSVRCFSAS